LINQKRALTPELMLIIWIDEELLSRRRLGKTKLQVKPGQVGTSNATKPENLGTFEYAHLRAPLPKDLKGSEIFASHQNQPHPETYFLMVRDSQKVKDYKSNFRVETEQGRLRQRDWDVQNCISVGASCRGEGRARLSQIERQYKPRRNRGERMDFPRIRCVMQFSVPRHIH